MKIIRRFFEWLGLTDSEDKKKCLEFLDEAKFLQIYYHVDFTMVRNEEGYFIFCYIQTDKTEARKTIVPKLDAEGRFKFYAIGDKFMAKHTQDAVNRLTDIVFNLKYGI